jgi:hypothetical protein
VRQLAAAFKRNGRFVDYEQLAAKAPASFACAQACALQRTPRNNLAEKARNGMFVITEIILFTRAHGLLSKKISVKSVKFVARLFGTRFPVDASMPSY